MRDGKGDELPKNIEILLGHAEMQLGRQKLSWSSNWQDMSRITRKASIGMFVASKHVCMNVSLCSL